MAEAKASLLLVDDEPRILSALERALRREGYLLEKADSVASALAILERRTFSLILSDYKMPGRNGAELLAVVRRRFPEMRRILLSGWTPEIAESELDAAAPDAVHAKPWDDEVLKDSIRALLEGRPRETMDR